MSGGVFPPSPRPRPPPCKIHLVLRLPNLMRGGCGLVGGLQDKSAWGASVMVVVEGKGGSSSNRNNELEPRALPTWASCQSWTTTTSNTSRPFTPDPEATTTGFH